MNTDELVTIKMSMTEALDIVRDHCQMTKLPDSGEYRFCAWANEIPGDLLHDKELIRITFKKV